MILRKIIKIVASFCHQMPDFKAKMRHIQFRQRATPLRELTVLDPPPPYLLAGFKGAYF